MKAMLFAAGLGTRLYPLTAQKPKALVEIDGRPLLAHSIDYLHAAGIHDITINVHHFGEQIIEFIRHYNDRNIRISDEREELLDTGGAILKARDFIQGEEPILLINVDVLTNLDLNALLNWHQKHQALATLVVRQRKTSRYLLVNQGEQLCGWTNKTTGEVKACRPAEIGNCHQAAFSGIHLIDPRLLNLITESGKFSIIDLYLRLAKEYAILAFNDRATIWMDLGKKEQLKEAENLLRKR